MYVYYISAYASVGVAGRGRVAGKFPFGRCSNIAATRAHLSNTVLLTWSQSKLSNRVMNHDHMELQKGRYRITDKAKKTLFSIFCFSFA